VGPGKTGLAENNLQSKEKCPSFYLSDFLSETSFAFFASGPTPIIHAPPPPYDRTLSYYIVHALTPVRRARAVPYVAIDVAMLTIALG
jgi:hypothetical protein